MQNTGGGAVTRIFVKVFGFSDVERHALNTVFRLSASRPLAYALWTAGAPDKAQLALVDGDSWEAGVALANPEHDELRLVWVGERPPGKAALVVARPLQWAAVIEGLDRLYARTDAGAQPGLGIDVAIDLDLDTPAASPLDIDLDLDQPGHAEAVTAPMPLEPAPALAQARVLVIEPDGDARLYLRAKLCAAGWVLVDDAETAAQALELLRLNTYGLVVLDLSLRGMDAWKFIKRLEASATPPASLIVTGAGLSLLDAARAWFAGARGALAKPLHPGKLKRLLEKLQKTPS